MSEALVELDLLLTGGRLEHKGAVQAAYQRDGWKAGDAMPLVPKKWPWLGFLGPPGFPVHSTRKRVFQKRTTPKPRAG